jgi:hypothetical protein
LEVLPINSSVYRMKYLGSYTFLNRTYDKYTVEIVYENIPNAIKDPANKNIKLTKGGPVTPFGRDWDIKKDGPYIAPGDRYNNNGPDFFGKESITEPSTTSSTNGIFNFRQGPYALEESEAKAARLSSPADGLQQAVGILGNITNQDIWNGKAKEQGDRAGFYKATNLIDENLFYNKIEDKVLKNGGGRTALINFITDGSLPTGTINTKNLSVNQLEYNLRVIYTGIQIMSPDGIKVKSGVEKIFPELIEAYKKAGGKIDFSKISEFIKKGNSNE